MVKEMVNDVNKFFDNSNDYYTNQQLIWCRDLFRVVIVKEWAMGNHNIGKLYACNKVLVKICIYFYHVFWKVICVEWHDLQVQKKVLKEEVEVIMEEANKKEIEWFRIWM